MCTTHACISGNEYLITKLSLVENVLGENKVTLTL